MFGWTRKAASPADFWAWLAANSARIRDRIQQNPGRIAAEVGRAFDRSFRELSWEVTRSDEGPWTFVISAEGNRSLFPRVLEAVRAAPALEGWTIQAFRPRTSLDGEMEFEGRRLTADDIWWSARLGEDDGKGGVPLTLWVRGLTPKDFELATAASVFLAAAAGEYDGATKIKDLKWASLPDDPRGAGDLSPLRELGTFLDGVPERPPTR